MACASAFQPDHTLTVFVQSAVTGRAIIGAQVHIVTTDDNVYQITNGNGELTVTIGAALSASVTVTARDYKMSAQWVPPLSADSTFTVYLTPSY